MQKFFMVVGEGVPNVRHATLDNAKKEAERLARCHIGTAFTVVESVVTVVKSDLQWIPHSEDVGNTPF